MSQNTMPPVENDIYPGVVDIFWKVLCSAMLRKIFVDGKFDKIDKDYSKRAFNDVTMIKQRRIGVYCWDEYKNDGSIAASFDMRMDDVSPVERDVARWVSIGELIAKKIHERWSDVKRFGVNSKYFVVSQNEELRQIFERYK